MGISDDPYWSWCFDEAAWTWSVHVEHELNAAAQPHQQKPEMATAARQQRMQQLLELGDFSPAKSGTSNIKKQPERGSFRDPADRFGKTG